MEVIPDGLPALPEAAAWAELDKAGESWGPGAGSKTAATPALLCFCCCQAHGSKAHTGRNTQPQIQLVTSAWITYRSKEVNSVL